MPAANDIVRAIVSWDNPVGGVFQNTFTFLLTSVATSLWAEVADDVEDHLEDALSHWLENVNSSIVSNALTLMLRDTVAGEWNTVYEQAYTGLAGISVQDTPASFASPKLILYPGAIRHWGFRNLPPPTDAVVDAGSLNVTGITDMLLTGAKLAVPYVGTFASWNNGVLSLATETFRGFTGSFQTGSAVGSRVTRKEGVGI